MEHTFPEVLGLNLILEAISFNRAADGSRTGIRSYVNKITFLHLASSSLPMLHSLWPLLGGKNHNKIGKKYILGNISTNRLFQGSFSPQILIFFLEAATEINIQNLPQSFDSFFNHQSSRKTGCTVSCLCHCHVRLWGSAKTTSKFPDSIWISTSN